MAPLKRSRIYAGIDRRATFERRKSMDRRNLVRYEAIGSDRRNMSARRTEDTTKSTFITDF